MQELKQRRDVDREWHVVIPSHEDREEEMNGGRHEDRQRQVSTYLPKAHLQRKRAQEKCCQCGNPVVNPPRRGEQDVAVTSKQRATNYYYDRQDEQYLGSRFRRPLPQYA